MFEIEPYDITIQPLNMTFNDVIMENMKVMAKYVVKTIQNNADTSSPLEDQINAIVERETDGNFLKETKIKVCELAYALCCSATGNGGGDASLAMDNLLQTAAIAQTCSTSSGIVGDTHMQKTCLQWTFNKATLKRISRRMYGQIHITNTPFKPGDSGTCIYVNDPVFNEQGCIGMAIANHPTDGCIATPIMEILKHFSIGYSPIMKP